MKTPPFWYRPAGVTAALLSPLGFLWRGGTALRRATAKVYRGQRPIICIGNIVAGGAGKTPTALAVAALLQQNGHNPVFVTRGYGGREAGPLRVEPEQHSARDVGDEALLLARAAPTWIGRDRAAATREAEKLGSHIILDDGLQNPSLRPDLAFLVVDGESGFGNGHMIPAGPLREPLDEALQRVTAVIVIGNDVHQIATRVSRPILRAKLNPKLPAVFPRTEKFFAFAGIGRPKKFYATCRKAGLTLVDSEDFPDHHRFSEADLARLRRKAEAVGAWLLTTEKDRVRLSPTMRTQVTALPVELEFDEPSAVMRLLNLPQ